jgi:hypothetical protein
VFGIVIWGCCAPRGEEEKRSRNQKSNGVNWNVTPYPVHPRPPPRLFHSFFTCVSLSNVCILLFYFPAHHIIAPNQTKLHAHNSFH